MHPNILLIDDEASLRRTLTLGLKQKGYSAVPCENGMAALAKLESYNRNELPFDVVVADLRLPDIDGLRLVKIIKFMYPEMPVIVITAYHELAESEEFENLKINALMEKPFSPDELSLQCDKILSQKPEVKAPAAEVKPKSLSAYVLLKTSDSCDVVSVFRELFFKPNVLYCDATRGYYDISLLLQAQNRTELAAFVEDNIKGLKGIEEYEFLEVENPVMTEALEEILSNAENALSGEFDAEERKKDFRKHVCSYLLVELEPEKFELVYPALRLNQNVVYCDCTQGRFNLVLMVYGRDFVEIDKLVREKIAALDGVLQVKELPVVNMMDM